MKRSTTKFCAATTTASAARWGNLTHLGVQVERLQYWSFQQNMQGMSAMAVLQSGDQNDQSPGLRIILGKFLSFGHVHQLRRVMGMAASLPNSISSKQHSTHLTFIVLPFKATACSPKFTLANAEKTLARECDFCWIVFIPTAWWNGFCALPVNDQESPSCCIGVSKPSKKNTALCCKMAGVSGRIRSIMHHSHRLTKDVEQGRSWVKNGNRKPAQNTCTSWIGSHVILLYYHTYI